MPDYFADWLSTVREDERKDLRNRQGRDEGPEEFSGFGKSREFDEESWEQWMDFVDQILNPLGPEDD